MISLSDRQLAIVQRAAAKIPVEKRSTFLVRIGAMLEMRGKFSDADVSDVAGLARFGLIHHRESESAA